MSTLMPDYQEGQVVHIRPQYATRHPKWAGAKGIIEDVLIRYLPKLKVFWLSGPKEGKTTTTPFYMVVPEGQEELLTMQLEDEDND